MGVHISIGENRGPESLLSRLMPHHPTTPAGAVSCHDLATRCAHNSRQDTAPTRGLTCNYMMPSPDRFVSRLTGGNRHHRNLDASIRLPTTFRIVVREWLRLAHADSNDALIQNTVCLQVL
jgi:hypothetical protein